MPANGTRVRSPGRSASTDSRGEARIDQLAPIVDFGRARLRAIGELLKQIDQLGVGAVRRLELFNAVDHELAARLAHDRQGWTADVGQGKRAIARQGRVLMNALPS